MRTPDFVALVAAVGQRLQPELTQRDQVLAVRGLVSDALRVDGFVLDCVELVLDSMSDATVPWRNPPIFTDTEHNYSIRLVYWPPRYANNPHEHRSWTVTGNIHNRLDVLTYRWGVPGDIDTLQVEKTLITRAGEVGYILPPCIHSVVNASDSVAASFHVFSGLGESDGNDAGAEDFGSTQTIWYPSPRKGEILRGARSRALLTTLDILVRIPGARSLALLDRIFQLGDARVQLASVKAMSRFDVGLAAERLIGLSDSSTGDTRARFNQVGLRLRAASRAGSP
jgi:hypothetical protein